MKPTVFKTNKAITTLEESNIVLIELTQGEDLSLDETLEIFNWVRDKVGNQKHYLIVEAGFGSTADPSVRDWLSSEERLDAIGADAFVVNSIAHKIVVNFYLKYNKPQHPTKAFTTVDDARVWIKEQIAAQNS